MQINRKALWTATTLKKCLWCRWSSDGTLRIWVSWGDSLVEAGTNPMGARSAAGLNSPLFSCCCCLRTSSGGHTFMLLSLRTEKLKWISALELFPGENLLPVFVWKFENSCRFCFCFLSLFYSLWFNLLVLWLQNYFFSGQGGGIGDICNSTNNK